MTPDVVVDVGNSRVKWGFVRGNEVAEVFYFPHDDVVAWNDAAEFLVIDSDTNVIVAGVHPAQVSRVSDWAQNRGSLVEVIDTTRLMQLTLPFNFHLDRELPEPEKIGVDRLLTALSGRSRTPDGIASITITIGTAMTVDLVRPDGAFVGGAILPGPSLMAHALFAQTAKLPQIDLKPARPDFSPGRNTKVAIEVGIAAAIVGTAEHLVRAWASTFRTSPWVFVAGGASSYLVGTEFSEIPARVIHDYTLTLDGLRLAAEALP
jgi:type III pantothenate kinase